MCFAVDGKETEEADFDLIDRLAKVANVTIPNAIEEIRTAPVLHNNICEKDEMKDIIKKFLAI